jgi:hypothetical protein
MLQQVAPNDRVVRFEFCGNIIDHIDEDKTFLSKIIFSGEATFRISRNVNMPNTRVYCSENSLTVVEHLMDRSKINICFFFLSCDKMYGHFFCGEKLVKEIIYRHMSELRYFKTNLMLLCNKTQRQHTSAIR